MFLKDILSGNDTISLRRAIIKQAGMIEPSERDFRGHSQNSVNIIKGTDDKFYRFHVTLSSLK